MEKIKSLILDNNIKDTLLELEEFENNVTLDENIYKIIPKTIISANNNNKSTLGTNLFYDLEFFKDYSGKNDNNVTYILKNGLKLKGSIHYFSEILANPIFCIDTLEKRQNILKGITDTIQNSGDDQRKDIENHFKILKENEDSILWLFDLKNSDKEFDMLYDIVYFNNIIIKNLNRNEHVLTGYNIYRIIISPMIGVISPISYFIVPYLILMYKYKINIKFTTYVKTIFHSLFLLTKGKGFFGNIKYISLAFSLIFYFQGLFNSFEISKAAYKISRTITNKMNNVIKYIKSSKVINDYLWKDDVNNCFVHDEMLNSLSDISYFEEYLPRKFGILTGFGSQLKIYKFIKNDKYIPLFRRIYILDTLVAYSSLSSKFAFSKYLKNNDKPVLEIGEMWHPCIKDNISNDININKQNNIIITGPNAGGKSTTIKTMLINVILSQTIGLSPCNSITLTPFYYISSQINIPDCKGKESLFEAEMYRSKENISFISNLANGNDFSILAMDEIFNSTNPVEGIAGAYAICKKLASFKNNICIISTHYLYITKLAKEFPESFVNYKMNVVVDADNIPINYPYKLNKGVSRQYIAIELLKENGFDADIIQDAIKIKNKFISTK